MENISIYAPGGALIMQAPVTASAKHTQELMKTDQVHLEWASDECVRLPLGAYIEYDSVQYVLAKPYYPESRTMGRYDYKIDFLAEVMLLANIPFMLITDTATECDWHYTGLAKDLKNTLETAINAALGSSQWSVIIDQALTGSVSLAFTSTSILSALNAIADALSCEWWTSHQVGDTTTKKIYFGAKCVNEGGETQTLELTAGEAVDYPSSNNKGEFFNRFYVFGSTRNIPQDYQGAQANTIVNKRLTLDPTIHAAGYMDLPKYDVNGNITETTSENPNGRAYWKADGTVGYYVVDDTVAQGARTFTKVLTLDDIYPRADLKVAYIAQQRRYVRDANGEKVELSAGTYSTYTVFFVQFVDSSNTVFDINPTTYQPQTNPNGHILPGTQPSVHFNSGALTGREFEVYKYHATAPTVYNEDDGTAVSFSSFGTGSLNKGIFELAYKEDNTIIIPNASIAPMPNDTAVVFNIRMPQAYVTKGYKDLDQAALVQMWEETKDGNEYTVKGNNVYFAEHNHGLALGRHVYFNTQGRRIDTRITKLTRNLDRAFELEISFSKAVVKGTIQALLSSVEDTQQQVVTTQLESTQNVKEAQKRAYDAQRELQDMIFDTDGYFKDGNIKPATIETLMLQVGAKSTNFILSGWVLTPNLNGSTTDPNHATWTSGKLTHYGLSETIREWNISSGAVDLTDSGAYYIYVKCVSSSGANAGTIVLSQEQIKYDDRIETETAYYFLVGSLSSVAANVRVANMSYGMSSVNGQFITTGVIKSIDGRVQIDLNSGTIYSADGISFLSGSTPKTFAEYVTETSQSITDVDNKIDNLQVGGNNVIPYSRYDTKKGLNSQMYGSPDVYSVVNDDEMGLCLEGSASIGNASACFAPFSLEPNKEYTFSFYYKMCGSTIGVINALFGHSKASFIQLMSQVGTTSNGATIVARDTEGRFSSGYNFPKDKNWHRYWVVFKADTTITSNYSELYIRLGSNKYGASSNVRWRVAKLQLEEGNKVTSWRCSDADIETQVEEVKTGLQQQIADLESQIDNEIEYWFGNGTPTLTNEPASAWTTDELKKAHVGDVYMDESQGLTYKFIVNDGVYSWKFLENDPSALAIAKATQALAEVGDKSAILYGGSAPQNYQKGDMWSRGAEYPLLICVTEGKHTTYSSSDWADAGEYIDAQARADAQTAQSTADGAVTTANNVDSRLNNLSMGGTNLFDGTEDINREVQYDYNKLTLTTAETTTEKEFVLSFDMSASSYSNECTLIFTDPRYKDNDGSWATDFYEVSSNINIGATTRTAEGRFDYFSLPDNSTYGYFCDGNYHRVWIRFKQLKDWSVVSSQYREPIKRTFVIYKNRSTDATIRIKNIKLEFGSVASAWSPSLNDTNSAISALQDMVTSLENQVDGQIEYYTYNYIPTANNIPASAWTTDQQKKDHIGDMFYNTSNSMTYKWVKKDGIYQWLLLENDPSAKALKTANDALSASESKNMVVYGGNQPNTPYKKGDLWIRQGEPILIASQDSNTYQASHWVDAPTYVDSTARSNAQTAISTANSANTTAGTALSTANSASSTANSALTTANTANGTANSALTTANNANSNASTALTTANTAKSSADTAKRKAEALEYLNNTFEEVQGAGHVTKIIGGLTLGEVLATKDATTGKVTAMVSGKTTDANSVAIACGRDVLGGDAPFLVRHDGSVEMSKALIQSGDSEQGVQIANGEIKTGGTEGPFTTLTGRTGGGVSSMIDKAVGGASVYYTNTAANHDSGLVTTSFTHTCDHDEAGIYMTQTEHLTAVSRCIVLLNTQVIDLSGIYTPKFSASGRSVTVSATCSNNAFTFSSNAAAVRYAVWYIQAAKSMTAADDEWANVAYFGYENKGTMPNAFPLSGGGWYYRLIVEYTIDLAATISGNASVAEGTTATVTLQARCSTSITATTSSNANIFKPEDFNNVIYRDGMLLSASRYKLLALSAQGTEMLRILNSQYSGFSVKEDGLKFLTAGGTYEHPISVVGWAGKLKHTSSGISAERDKGVLTLQLGSSTTGVYTLQVYNGSYLEGRLVYATVAADDGYATLYALNCTSAVIASTGSATLVLSTSIGTNYRDWWSGYSSKDGATANMANLKLTLTII